MRGLAAVAAAAAGWVLVTGVLPRPQFDLPRVQPKTAMSSVAVFAVSSATLFGLVGIPVAAIVVGALLAAGPIVSANRVAKRSAERVRDGWPDVLARVRTSISAGATLGDAVTSAMFEAGGPFSDMAEAIRREVVIGGGLQAGLATLRSVDSDPLTDRIVATLSAASAAGGRRVGDIVGVLGQSAANEIRLRKAHDAALTEQRMTVNVALAAPWVILLLTIATNPQAAEAFSTSGGAVVVGVGLVGTILGWILAVRTARLNGAPRVFR